jgi:hypothetical protein
MNTKSIIAAVVLATGVGGAGAFAQPSDSQNPAPPPSQIIYLPQLPAASELAKSAPAQGVTVAQITQTSDQITVVYKLANGQTNAVEYKLLSAVEPSTQLPAGAPAGPAPTTAVVYAQTVPVYPAYYGPDYGYWPWYGPVRVDLGFGWGWGSGWRGGGWRGGGWRR